MQPSASQRSGHGCGMLRSKSHNGQQPLQAEETGCFFGNPFGIVLLIENRPRTERRTSELFGGRTWSLETSSRHRLEAQAANPQSLQVEVASKC